MPKEASIITKKIEKYRTKENLSQALPQQTLKLKSLKRMVNALDIDTNGLVK
jgi:hypothetical protein